MTGCLRCLALSLPVSVILTGRMTANMTVMRPKYFKKYLKNNILQSGMGIAYLVMQYNAGTGRGPSLELIRSGKMAEKVWVLREGVKMDENLANEVAKIACALQSLSAYTRLACAAEDAPQDLEGIVDEGLEAMKKIFVW
jgi:hypothetical protein